MERLRLERVPPATVVTGWGFRAAAAKVELTPPMGTWTAGWGPGLLPRRAVRFISRLYARLLVLDDGAGERVALIAADLHAGSRYLSERIAQHAAPAGFHVGRVVLAGNHAHAGPGNLYASAYYDAFCTSFPWVRGFHRELADDLSQRIASALVEACTRLEPATARFGTAAVWNWSANRSLAAALENLDEPHAQDVRAAVPWGAEAPAHLASLERLLVNPRLEVISAFRPDGSVIGCFGTFAAHNALLAREHQTLSADWFGVAQHEAESLLRARFGHDPIVGLAAGAIGDADPRPPGVTLPELLYQRQRSLSHNLTVMKNQGARLGAAVLEAVAASGPPLLTLEARYAEPVIAAAPVHTPEGLRTMPTEARIGASTLAGSELGRGALVEGIRDHDDQHRDDPHWPKADDEFGMKLIEPILRVLDAQSPTVPLRLVKVGDLSLLGLPGEPTTFLSMRLAEVIRAATGARSVMVAGTCGDYLGYLTTRAEYLRQHYEGASTIWGRHTQAFLEQALSTLATLMPPTPSGALELNVERFTGTVRRTLAAHRALAPLPPPPLQPPRVQRVGALLTLSGGIDWLPTAAVPIFEWGEWLRVHDAQGVRVEVEPMVVLDELGEALWWSVTLDPVHAGTTFTVELQHPDAVGRYTVSL